MTDLIDYYLTSSEQYFSYIKDENKFNIKTIEMREEMDQQQPLKKYGKLGPLMAIP